MNHKKPFIDERKLTYLNSEGANKPLKSAVSSTVLDRARHYRLARLREQLQLADLHRTPN